MHQIYCISGLGADKRIFDKLQIPNAQLHFIEWQLPGAHDSMQDYARLLAAQVKHENIVLMGVSFGGMLATEITRLSQAGDLHFHITKTIIISSCKCRSELPVYLRMAGRLGLYKCMPLKQVLHMNRLNKFVFDLRSTSEELYLKRVMLRDSALELIRRSIRLILTWRGANPPQNILHIHGTSDRMLLPGSVKADHWIKGAGHFMIWNEAAVVSRLINAALNTDT